jgi:hypothetical protein
MRKMNIRFAAMCITLSACSSVYAAGTAEYLDFFNKYQTLSNSFDISVTQLYSDDAVILGTRKMNDGIEQKLKMDGKKWKEILSDSMKISEQRGDRSEFSDIAVHLEKDRATITADRYSTLKCFHDKKYYMVVAEKGDGAMEIVEEAVESPVQSYCENGSKNDLALVLQGTVAVVNKQLPQMVDNDTRLEKASSDGNTLVYHYMLVNNPASAIDPAALQKTVEPMILQQSCAAPNLRSVIDQGGSLLYSFNGNDNAFIVAVKVDRSRCNK